MTCNICDKYLSACSCPDIDERMAAMAKSPSNSMSWCITCDKHWQRCQCERPHLRLTNEILKDIDG